MALRLAEWYDDSGGAVDTTVRGGALVESWSQGNPPIGSRLGTRVFRTDPEVPAMGGGWKLSEDVGDAWQRMGTFDSRKDAAAWVESVGGRIARGAGRPPGVPNPVTTLTFGVLPTREAFTAVVAPELPFTAELVGADARVAAEVGYHGEELDDPDELYDLIENLTELYEEGDEDAGALASGIMQVSGFEWV